MSLTGNEITAGGTYTVRIDKQALSFKRGNDAVTLVKGINGRVEEMVYDPGHPAAFRTGWVKLENPQPAVSAYDGAAQTWTVTIPAGSIHSLAALRALVDSYGAEVTEGAGRAPAAQVAPAARPASRARWADVENGDGFTNEERAAMPNGGR